MHSEVQQEEVFYVKLASKFNQAIPESA